ncbi:hypothetical protein N9954_09000 [Maribacter sp.]|nr:hypothetical protein [Maribacter sp.]
MKSIYLFLVFLVILCFGCKTETPKTNSQGENSTPEAQNASTKIEDFNCVTFFKKGDFSSICFSDAKLPAYNGMGCIFDFVTQGNKQEQRIKVQLDPKGSVSLAQMSFNLYRTNYKKGKVTEVAEIGDAAFFDVHGTDLKSLSRSNKDLYVRYKNITFIIMAEYLSNTEIPCYYKDENLIAFAKVIIQNL